MVPDTDEFSGLEIVREDKGSESLVFVRKYDEGHMRSEKVLRPVKLKVSVNKDGTNTISAGAALLLATVLVEPFLVQAVR